MVSKIDNLIQTSTTKSYWCHICKHEFSKIFIEDCDVKCRQCGKTFVEEIQNENNQEHPSSYQPYVNISNTSRRRDRLSEVSPILDLLSSLVSFNEDENMENILSYLMANDPNKYGNPPASKEEVSKLVKIIVSNENIENIKNLSSESTCSVCKDEYEIDQSLLQLPCSHLFHDDCILPWLKERNSCPTCRFELKTDDKDYEKRKNEKKNEMRMV